MGETILGGEGEYARRFVVAHAAAQIAAPYSALTVSDDGQYYIVAQAIFRSIGSKFPPIIAPYAVAPGAEPYVAVRVCGDR